jgi:hypothetical protein
MAVTVQDLFSKIDPNKMQFMQANAALMALDIGGKKKPPSAQIAMPEDVVRSLMFQNEKSVSLVVIAVERDEWDKAVKEVMGT